MAETIGPWRVRGDQATGHPQVDDQPAAIFQPDHHVLAASLHPQDVEAFHGGGEARWIVVDHVVVGDPDL